MTRVLAAVLLTLAGHSPAAADEAEVRRWPIGKVFPSQAGSVFREAYTTQADHPYPFPDATNTSLGGKDAVIALDNSIRRAKDENLSLFYVTSLFESQSLLVLKSLIHAIDPGRNFATVTVDARYPDGSVKAMPLRRGQEHAAASAILAAKELRRRPRSLQLSGDYVLQATSDCPVESGDIRLNQNEAVVEGVRGDVPFLIGAMSGSVVAFWLPEQSYAETRVDRSGSKPTLTIKYPVVPQRFFGARLDQAEIALMPTDASRAGSCLSAGHSPRRRAANLTDCCRSVSRAPKQP